MAEEYTPEQKKKIARHFVLVSPHGEVHDLVKDLRKVVGKKLLDDNWRSDCLSEYARRRFVLCEGPTSKVICCPQGALDADTFLNPAKKVVCTVDPVTQKVTDEKSADAIVAKGEVANFRSAIDIKLKEYLNGFYEDGSMNPSSHSRGMGSVYASQEGVVAVVISFNNLNVSNFWTGGWQSEWTLNVGQGKGSKKLEGRIRLNIHYYEDGNVQLSSTFTESGEVDVSDPESTAKALINTIETLETDFQKRLEKFYVQMHETTFKSMRRFLPKTGTKFDWRSGVHKLTAEAASK